MARKTLSVFGALRWGLTRVQRGYKVLDAKAGARAAALKMCKASEALK